MDKPETDKFKALCYNCLTKLSESDITAKECPNCFMKINHNGLPLKGGSNFAWKKSDTNNDKIDENINMNIAIEQGFHFGTISRLRYGITEGNTDKWIINPDKSFIYKTADRELLINKYKITESPIKIEKSSSLNLLRNGIKEMLENSKFTPSIIYIRLKKHRPDFPKHIILVEKKFIDARYGKETGLNLLLNIIHTNNFFPVTSALHRQTAIFKIHDNYQDKISTAYLFPSTNLRIEERINHNHVAIHTNKALFKKGVEDSLKFNNIEEFHQYIPTLASKKTLMLSDDKHETTDIIEDTMDDDQESLMSNISIGSQGEIKSKKTLLSPKSIKSKDEPEEDDKTEILSLIKSKSSQDDKVDVSEKESEEFEEGLFSDEIGIDFLGPDGEYHRSDEDLNVSEEEEDVSHINEDENVRDDGKETIKSTTSVKSNPKEMDTDDKLFSDEIGIDFLGPDGEYKQSSDRESSDKHSKIKTKKDYDERKEDESKSHDEKLFSDEIGIDFLGPDGEYHTSEHKKKSKETIDSPKFPEVSDEELISLDDLSLAESEPLSEESIMKINRKINIKSIDLDDHPTPLHDFWGTFSNKNKIRVESSRTEQSWDGNEEDSDDELGVPTRSDREIKSKTKKETEKKELKKPTKIISLTVNKKKTKKSKLENKSGTRLSKKKTKKNKLNKNSNSKTFTSPKKITKKNELKKNTKIRKRDSKGRYVSASKKKSNTTSKIRHRDSKGRYVSPKKKKSVSKRTPKKRSSPSQKIRDSKGRFISPEKSKKDNSSRDSKGRFKKRK